MKKKSGIEKDKVPLWKRLLKRLGAFTILCMLGVWLLLTLIQLPFIQSYVSQKASEYLSEQLKTEVKIDGFRLNFFDALTFQNVLIKDLTQDTLLYANELHASFDKPLITLFQNNLYLEGISISKASFFLKRTGRDSLTNLERLIQNVQEENTSTIDTRANNENSIEPALNISIKYLDFRSLHFVNTDSLYGHSQDIRLGEAYIGIEKIDLENMVFEIQKLSLYKPDVTIVGFKGTHEEPIDETEAPELPFQVKVKKLLMKDGVFNLNNFEEVPHQYNAIDYARMRVRDINMDFSNVQFHNWRSAGVINNFSFQSEGGYALKSFTSDSVIVSPEETTIMNGRLQSSKSDIVLDLRFTYDGFDAYTHFVDDVYMDVRSYHSKIIMEDIMKFAPELYDLPLFKANKNKRLYLDGIFKGTVNDFESEKVYVKLGNSMLDGKIAMQQVASDKDMYMDLNVTQLSTDMEQVYSLLPDTNNQILRRLGKIFFKGRYSGTLESFTSDGFLNTSLGNANINVSVDLRKGMEKATYKGAVSLSQFDLGGLLANEKLGRITMESNILDGNGLTLESLSSDVTAKVDSLGYNNYIYKSIVLDGKLENYEFNGNLHSKDKNLRFDLEGIVNYKTIKHPSFDAELKMKNADLQALNFTNYPMKMSFDIKGEVDSFDIYDFNGNAYINNIIFQQNDTTEMFLDRLTIESKVEKGLNVLELDSEILEGTIKGDYSIFTSFQAIKSLISKSYPTFAKKMNIEQESAQYDTELELDLILKNSASFEKLISPNLKPIKDLSINSYVNAQSDTLFFKIYTPSIEYKDHKLKNPYFFLESKGSEGNFIVSVDSTIIGDRIRLMPISIFGDVVRDTMFYMLNLSGSEVEEDELNLEGKLFTNDQFLLTSINEKDIKIFAQDWKINRNNLLELGTDHLLFRNFDLTSNKMKVSLKSKKANDLFMDLQNIELGELNDMISADSLFLYGNVDFHGNIENVLELESINVDLSIEDFKVNNDDYGLVKIVASDEGAIDKSKVDISIVNPKTNLRILGNGYVYPTNSDAFYDLDLSVNGLYLSALEYLLYKSISNTKGGVSGEFTVTGELTQPEINGIAHIEEGQTTFDYLGVTYYMKDARIELTPSYIDFSNQKIYDPFNNVATVQGKLLHDRFSDWGMDLSVSANDFLLINTTKQDNSFYYGTAFGAATVDFSGSFTYPNIDIEARNTSSSEFFLNVATNSDVDKIAFVDFKSLTDSISSQVEESEIFIGPTGLNLSLDLNVNDKGKVNIIMDESGDGNITGYGNGNLILNVDRAGEVSLFGDYNITSGEYTYTMQFVNKPFEIQKGSYVTWSGDPLDAQINIRAKYDTYASTKNLISQYVSNLDRQNYSNTKVSIFVLLNGDLFSPTISFDLEVPEVSGQERAYVDDAISVLKSKQADIDYQAMSLLTFGTFTPGTFNGDAVANLLGSTLSEVITSYVSSYLSSFTNNAVKNVDFIDELNVSMRYGVEIDGETGVDLPGVAPSSQNNEIGGGFELILLDGKMAIQGEVINYGEKSLTSGPQENFLGGKVSVDYILNDARTYRLSYYGNQDLVFEGQRLKNGLGISYSKDFDSFHKYFRGLFGREEEAPKIKKGSTEINE